MISTLRPVSIRSKGKDGVGKRGGGVGLGKREGDEGRRERKREKRGARVEGGEVGGKERQKET